ncbi:hypothetical protein M413DRAFT_72341, partial [Hebeloma cylindrosporum]
AKEVAEAFGYTEEELSSVPDGSHLGLSCGNPLATANIKEGERVVDLGSGGGIDVFLAAAKVGPTGSAIGLDMSDDMIARARSNAATRGLKPPQVAFVKALLTEPLPIESNSVDCVLSNCVVNLLPAEGKASLLKEVTRILRPGGRVVLDDIVATKSIPESMRNDIASYVACISGAITLEEYQSLLKDAGLPNATFVETKSDLNVYFENDATAPCCSDSAGAVAWKPSYDINEWVGSYQIYALKDGAPVEKPPTVLSNWWAAYPIVKSSPPRVTAEEVVALKKDPASSNEFAVIDVRRNDHAGGHVRGSDNWAAQTFYDNLPGFYEKYKDTPKVIFYCQSSNGRGPRSAGWYEYQDYIDSQEGHKSTAYVLEGGIKSWLAKYGDDENLVDRD